VLKAFRKRLKGANKMAKVVIVAVMRKMITMLNAMVRDDVVWADHLSRSALCADRSHPRPVLVIVRHIVFPRSQLAGRAPSQLSVSRMAGLVRRKLSSKWGVAVAEWWMFKGLLIVNLHRRSHYR
jgi:hypothetical protein